MIYIATYVLSFATLVAVVYASGAVLAKALPRSLGPSPDALTRFTLAIVFWCYFAFGLCAIGQFRPAPVWATVAAFVAAFVVLALRRKRSGIGWRFALPKMEGGAWLFAGVLGLILLAIFFKTITPYVAWDADAYHLTVPRLYLENHGFRRIPFNVFSNWPLNVEMLFGLAIMAKGHVLAKLAHFGFGLLTIWTLGRFCAFRGGKLAAMVAVALFLINGSVLWEMQIAYVDLGHAFFFFAAFVFLIRFEGNGRRADLLLSGLCCGAMAGTKLTGAIGVLCLAPIAAPIILGGRRPISARGVALAIWTIPILAMGAAWAIKAYYYTGNPVYPFLYSWFGGPEWSGELARRFSDWQSSIGMGRSLLDYVLLPIRVILSGDEGYDNFDGFLSPVWIIAIPTAVVFGLRDRMVRRCLLTSLLFFVFWAATSQQIRLLIPVLPFLAASAGLTLPRLWEVARLRERQIFLTNVLAIGLTGLLLFSTAVEIGGGANLARNLARQTGDIESLAVRAYIEAINEKTPYGARIVMLNTNRGFFCERDYIADSCFEASQIADWLKNRETAEDTQRELRRAGVTHILVHSLDLGMSPPAGLKAMIADPVRVTIVAVEEENEWALLKIEGEIDTDSP